MNISNEHIYRFSEAPIWELQRSYFEEQGIEAWQSDQVPQYITNNPVIAAAYAEIIFGFLQDRARLGYTSETVTIVELGAGSGRLAFHVLTELIDLIAFAALELPPFRYVMSDLPLKNITYWQQHPSLQPFVQQGVLDFAVFDAVQDTELHLTQSGDTIKPNDLKEPLLIVANYFFDSIPQELLYVDEGNILECRVSFTFPEDEASLSKAGMLEHAVPEYHYFKAGEYDQDSYPYREVIELYKEKLEDSHILFPVIGLECLERLGRLSQEGFVLLTADKGDHRIEYWEFAEPPKLIHHGSFSLTANYHALQHVFEQKGALSMFTEHHYKNLNVGCMIMLQNPATYVQTRLAYRRFVDRFGPDDFFSMKLWFDKHLDQMELSQMVAFWRLGRYDAELFVQSAKRMLLLLTEGGDEEAEDIRNGIHVMWGSYYPMQEKGIIATNCGLLLYQLELYEEARVFFEEALNNQVATAEVLYGMAICCYEAGSETEASTYVQQLLELEPKHEEARALLAMLV